MRRKEGRRENVIRKSGQLYTIPLGLCANCTLPDADALTAATYAWATDKHCSGYTRSLAGW